MAKFDVLKPTLIWIGDRCYRKFSPRQLLKENPEDDEISKDYIQEKEMNSIQIHHENDSFWSTMQVPVIIYKALGKSVANRVRKSKAKLNVIHSKEYTEMTVSAADDRSVYETCRQINVLVENARLKLSFNHFVSIPMNFVNIKQSFVEFKKDVLEHCKGARGLSESIFQDPNKLHLTVVPLLLLGSQEKETATLILQECKDEICEILRKKELIVQVKGIEYMNDDPEEVDVLYAKVVEVDNDDCLQRIANLLMMKFFSTKFSTRQDYERVKLHITLMNSIMRSEEDCSEEKQQKKSRESFDAKKILEKYQDYDFGTVTLSEIHISIRYTKNDDGYYMSTAVLNFPTD